ncbi:MULTISPECIES: diguanylate cyclase [unclassified Pseudomonas]|uniref:sensor domain-containing diguanylate cyclase n=1 Tax=unclassified Pseudomonas TaxID=196821 RepID=UPI000BD4EF24|nr:MULTISPECIES: diguanylate cyclase [unclassified Pseudomonas]PVZ13698.1 PAS domain S-box-containing protein/diguanylate cyclase (GGDEF)-like protein [Pseudomonas sp. URIL14HWK12:I12]PVZ24004.1 PAS domain S-box-containing protein/diguanylate cyclase (GGDEF)-like protein [Pseudomonas sp. URIL14HWK12:I10]PVZ33357.1 PAS domain S-box-containing protein/diguanylate cyclase (GGDEF)-like protein [Pseudomonas sp. URIL14HWK12:I11]SNZ11276.1 diguanylate cyclase with PAS/PAC sensor [Pseudomonas sp. URIL1
MPPSARPRILGFISEGASAWLVACVGLLGGGLVSVMIASGLDHLAQEQLHQRFELLAQERFSRLQERFFDQQQRLASLQRFFAFSEQVSRSEFNGYAGPLLQLTQTYAWLPRITDAERDAFERRARVEGLPGFSILDWNGAKPAPAGRRADYYPVFYLRSASRMQMPLGLDPRSEPVRAAAFNQAVATAAAAASAPLKLMGIEPERAQGLLLVAPVYQAGTPAGAGPPMGFVTAAVSIGQLMTEGLPKPGEDNLRLTVRDVTLPAEPLLLYSTGASAPGMPLMQTRTLQMGGRVYQLAIVPSEVFALANRTSTAQVALLFGGLLSVLVAGLLFSLVSQGQRALALVARRTAQLSESETRLRRIHGQLQNVLDAATEVAIIATDLKGCITTFNAGAERMLDYRAEQVVGKLSLADLHVHHELRERVRDCVDERGLPCSPARAMLEASLRDEAPQAQHWTLVRRNGAQVAVSMLVTAVHDEHQQAIGHLAVCQDVTESQRTLQALAARDRLLEKLSAEVPGGIFQFRLGADGSNCFTYLSRGMQDIYEVAPERLYADGAPAFERMHPADVDMVRESIRVSARELSRWRQEYRVCLPRQGLRWVRGEATPEAMPDGAIIWHGSLFDITDLKRVEEELRALSITDALTGINNRRYFQERLQAELERARRDGTPLSVIMLDVDHFKSVNDRFGHALGDTVLQALCRRVAARLRRNDIFCRLGGEEFIILCPSTDGAQAQALAEDLRQALERAPVDGVGVVTGSFGVASWQAGEGGDALLQRADAAVYAAKQKGRNRVEPHA